LATVYNLPIKPKEMDFNKSNFWKKIEKETGPEVVKRYSPFTRLFDEIIKWRDAAVHRLTPLVIPHSPISPSKARREQISIKVVSQPEAEISMVAKAPKSIPWVEPLYFYKQWQNKLIEFCREVCLDIKSQTL